MGRKKIRNHLPREHYEKMLETYFTEHQEEVITDLLNTLGYSSLEALRDDEYNMAFGFDCGWTKLVPKNREMFHEWELDNGKYCAEVYCRPTYYPQSTTIQRVQVEKAVRDLGLGEEFRIVTRLD